MRRLRREMDWGMFQIIKFKSTKGRIANIRIRVKDRDKKTAPCAWLDF